MPTTRCECVRWTPVDEPSRGEPSTPWSWPRGAIGPGARADEPAPRMRARRKVKIPKACRAALSACMSRGSLKQRKARAGSCMTRFQRCRRRAKR